MQSCGGGGGGGNNGSSNPPPPPPPPPPPDSNLIELFANETSNYAISSFYSAEDAYFAMLVLGWSARDLQDNQLESLVFQCSAGGSVTLSVDNANDNDVIDAGDTLTVAYAACNGNVTGHYLLQVTNASFDQGILTALAGAVSFEIDFIGSADAALSGTGDFAFTVTATTLNWLGTDLRVTYSSGGLMETFDDARVRKIYRHNGTHSFGFDGTVDSDFVGGRFTVETEQAFEGVEGEWPTSGKLVVGGRNTSTVSYAPGPQPQLVSVEIDADGNGVVDDLAHILEWSAISSGFGFGVSEDVDVPPPSNEPDLIGRRIALGAAAKDLAVNPSRGQFYVTIPSQNELLVFSADTLEVVRRVRLPSRPSGVSVSADGNEVIVGLAGSGTISILDAGTFTETRIQVAPQLESSEVYQAVETAPGILYVSSGTSGSVNRMARVDRAAGTVTPVAATGYAEIELIAVPAQGVLFAADGFQAQTPTVRKLDASVADSPLLHFATHEIGDQTHRLSLDATGSRLHLASGLVLDTGDLSRIGRISAGVPRVSGSGMEVFVASGARDLYVHDAASLAMIDALETDCWRAPASGSLFGAAQRLMPSPVDGQWLILGESALCVVDFLNPEIPPGTGNPGVPPEPLPVTTVASRKVHWSSSMFDAEYDDARKRLYVSLLTAQELVTIDAENAQILSREPLGHTARGIDLSPDGSTLAIMYNDNGRIAFKDLETGTISTRNISGLLGTPAGYDVVWLDNDILFASADPPCCEEPYEAYLARVSRSDPSADRRSAGGVGDLWTAELAISPDGQSLFLNRGPNEALKVDLTLPGEPIVRTATQRTDGLMTGQFGHPRISPDGSLIAYSNGQVLRTDSLVRVGEIQTGRSVFSPDGATLFGAFSSFVDRYDASTFAPFDRLAPTDNCNQALRLIATVDGSQVISASLNNACFFLLNEPVTTAFKVKANIAYTCGTACMQRNLRKKSAADYRNTPNSRGILRPFSP